MNKDTLDTFASIKVCGIGGSGGNAVSRMIAARVRGVEFIAINTDAQALMTNPAPIKVQIGKETTQGLGAGADTEVGRKSAEENKDEIYEVLKGANMVFVTCGAGGGTGTGAAPLIAQIAKELGALTVGVVTKPFSFEGLRRKKIAELGIEELREKVDTLITIPNDRLLQVIDKKTSMTDAFGIVDDILRQGVQGISEIIVVPAIINVDFADVRTIMKDAGSALMGIGRASGENRAIEAARQAIDSPLLELSIDGARGILYNITGGSDMTMYEVEEVSKAITEAADPEANVIFGATVDDAMSGEIKVTVIATGFENEIAKPAPKQRSRFGSDDNAYSSPLGGQHQAAPTIPFFGTQSPPAFAAEIEPIENNEVRRRSFMSGNDDAPETKRRGFQSPSDDNSPAKQRGFLSPSDDTAFVTKNRGSVVLPKDPAQEEDELDVPSFIRRKLRQ